MKHYFLAAVAALCAFIVTGCSKETDNTQTPVGKQVVMVMESATEDTQTRADYTDGDSKMNFSWTSGDALSVVVNGVIGNENCRLSTTESGKSVSFSGSVTTFTGEKDVYAFYPHNTTAYTVTGGESPATATATLTLPTTQQYTIGGAISNSFMVGVGTATASRTSQINASASLKQVMSIIKLNITNAPGKVTAVKLKCSEAVFPTTATVKLIDATISSPDNLVNELSMTVTDETTGVDKAVSFAMFPTNLSDKYIKAEVTFNDEKSTIVRTIKKRGMNFERNEHYVMSFSGAEYIEVEGIKVAIGNLVADGANGAKIGAPDDYGLYFQFGSLVGWSGGVTGDGTGGQRKIADLSIQTKPIDYTGSTVWSASWIGDATSDDPAVGTGDPCRYYLGSNWRLPTKAEFDKIFKNSGYPSTGPWLWTGSSALHRLGLELPAAGTRLYTNGSMTYPGQFAGYWSASVKDKSSSYYVSFAVNSDDISSSFAQRRAYGFSVRCVRD